MFNNVLGSIGYVSDSTRTQFVGVQQFTYAINEHQGQEGLGAEGVAALFTFGRLIIRLSFF
jgi:hypothetical protein